MMKFVLFLALLFQTGAASHTGAIAGTGGGPFSPTSLSGLQFWFSADCITFPSSVCGTPSTGSSVTAWADQSGNANNLTKTGGTCTFNTNQVNTTLPAVTFASCTYTLGSALAASSGHTAFIVYKTLSAGTTGYIIGSSTLGGFAYEPAGPTAVALVDKQNNVNVGQATNHASTWIQSNVVMQNFASTFILNFRMTQAVDTTSTFSNQSITTTGPSGVGADLFGGTTGAFNGQLAELIYYNQTLTLTQIQQVEAYLHTKYNL